MDELPKDAKSRGQLAELMFAVEARKRGLQVLTTLNESAVFDLVILNSNGKFFKVQVKSALHEDRKRHTFTLKQGTPKTRRGYHADQIDVVACFCFDSNDWYLIPITEVAGDQTVKISPGSKHYKYLDGWETFYGN